MTPRSKQPKEHPQRCETCGYGIMNCINETAKCSYGITLLPSEIILIKQIGCASHSSRPHPAPAQRDDNWHYTPDEMKQHDAAISRKAREDECERIYGLFHEVERLHLNGMAYPDLYNEMVARIKFIHTEPLSKDGRKKESLRSTQQQAGEP